jgi:hypothetical protein
MGRFQHLLERFSELTAHQDRSVDAHVSPMQRLLGRFEELRKAADAAERIRAASSRQSIRVLLDRYGEANARYCNQQARSADDFNLLDVMQLTGKEIRHSMMLAWMLDHDLRRLGTHAQGALGFRLFLVEFDELRLPLSIADTKYWVRREVAGEKSIVDIEIGCRGQFLIHIENKIWSSEGTDQTNREWDDVQRKAAELRIPDTNVRALYLTPTGAPAANGNFHCVSWLRIARVVEAFAQQSQPPDVKLFAAHYTRSLRRFIATHSPGVQTHDEAANE